MIYDLNPRNMNTRYKTHHSPHLFLAQKYWKEHVRAGDIVVDATAGNGHDTLFLSQIVLCHPEGSVYAYDIQKEALDNTKNLLLTKLPPDQLSRVILCNQSHETIHKIAFQKAPRLIVYNLGYLPGGDKAITTQTKTTLKSMKSCLQLLSQGGALSITCYPGHEEGAREEKAITEFLSSLPSKEWLICHHRYLNRPHSPTFIWVLMR
jgi:hypothetical protein